MTKQHTLTGEKIGEKTTQKPSFQHTLDNEILPNRVVKCIKASDNFYITLPLSFEPLSELYKVQRMGTSIVLHPYKRFKL